MPKVITIHRLAVNSRCALNQVEDSHLLLQAWKESKRLLSYTSLGEAKKFLETAKHFRTSVILQKHLKYIFQSITGRLCH